MKPIEQILYHFFKCEYKGYAEKIFLELKPSMIDERDYRYIYQEIQSFEKEYKRLPNIGEMKVRIEKDEVLQAFVNLMDRTEIGEIGQDVIYNVSEDYIKAQSIMYHIGMIYEHVENFKFDEVASIVDRIATKVLPFSFSENHWIRLSDVSRVRSILIENEELYSNGRLIQNFVQGGGTPRGTFTVYAGASHSGKSMFLMNDANNYAQLGHNVLVFTLEMKDKTIIRETYSERTGFSKNSINRLMEDVNYKEHFSEYFPKTNQGDIFVEEMSEGSLTVGGVRSIINELELKEQIKIDVIVIDYINLMKTDKKLARDERVKELIEPLRGLCKELNIIGISATQLTRKFDELIEGNPEKIFEANKSHIQEGDALFRACDYVYIILNSELLKSQNRIYLKCVKLRETDGFFLGRRIALTFDNHTSKLLETQDDSNKQIIANDKLYNELLRKYEYNYDTFGLRCLDGQGLSKQIELTNKKYKDSRFNSELKKNAENIVIIDKPKEVKEVNKIEEEKEPEKKGLKYNKKNVYDADVEKISSILSYYEELDN